MFEQCGGNWQGSRLLISKEPGFEANSSPCFFVFPSATSICYVAKWVCPIFFLVWAESRKITKLDLVCLGTMGCSKT